MISLASDATANKAVVFLRSVVQTSSLRSVVLTGNHLGNPALQVRGEQILRLSLKPMLNQKRKIHLGATKVENFEKVVDLSLIHI